MTMTTARTSSYAARPIEQLVSEISALHSQFDATAAESEELGDAPQALVDLMRQIRVPMILFKYTVLEKVEHTHR